MWTYLAYRWPDEASFLAALAEAGWAEGTPPGVDLLVSGVLQGPPMSAETPGEVLAGWHVAAAFRDQVPPAGWAARRITPPEGMALLGHSPVPVSVTRFQARAALAMAGLLPAVEAAIAASPDLITRLAWADAQVFERGSPTIASLAGALGLTEAQIDALFQTAGEIVA
jgi:hypothetical protein